MQRPKIAALSCLLLAACVASDPAINSGRALAEDAPRFAGPAQPVGNAPLAGAQKLSDTFHDVSNRVGPSVVSIRSMSRRGRLQQQGSGVLLRSDGVIVTNNHVVKDASGIQIQLGDGRTYSGTVIGSDPATDLAVLRIDADNLDTAPMEDADVTAVGEWVLAMGNPLGLGHTVTAGIVSGLGHSGLDIARYEDFIQTDAAINPGNSGGPLVNLAGRVIGINTAIGTRSAGSEGIAYAIPIRIVRVVLEAILAEGEVTRAWLGADMFDATTLSLYEAGFDGISRAVIRRVRPGSPAEDADMQKGDVVVSFAGRAIRKENDLINAVAESRPGSTSTIEVWRDGRMLSRKVTLD
ncbi:MAG: serine protease Do [Planctomycetota bacterium]|jgi:serine protease Do